MKEIIRRILYPFQSVKLNIVLFAVLALSAVLGTVIPQIPESAERASAFLMQNPKWGAICLKLGLLNVYTSSWFVGLLALMAFNVIVCKLVFGKFPGSSAFKKGERKILPAGAICKSEWIHPESDPIGRNLLREKLAAALAQERYKIVPSDLSAGEVDLLAVRQPLQRWGSWISHIAIVLVLFGSLISALYGFKEQVMIPAGSNANLTHRPWSVAVDSFTVDFYPGTETPSAFTSQIRILDADKEVAAKKIQVNYPLEWQGVRFYQASYSPALKAARVGVFLRDRPKESVAVWLHPDEEVPVPGTDLSLRAIEYVPDLTVSPEGKVKSKSANPNNPGLHVLIYNRGQPQKAVWIFSKYPTMQMPPLTDQDRVVLIFAEFEQTFSSGIQVGYDPGAPIFWAACAILVVALMILFYLDQRRIWLRLTPVDAGTKIELAAISSRGKGFENEFTDLVRRLKEKSA